MELRFLLFLPRCVSNPYSKQEKKSTGLEKSAMLRLYLTSREFLKISLDNLEFRKEPTFIPLCINLQLSICSYRVGKPKITVIFVSESTLFAHVWRKYQIQIVVVVRGRIHKLQLQLYKKKQPTIG